MAVHSTSRRPCFNWCKHCCRRASRNSFLSGRRPDRTRVWNFLTDFRMTGGDHWNTFPEYLKNHGYTTLGAGKVRAPCGTHEA